MSATIGHNHKPEVWSFVNHMVNKANRNVNNALLIMVARDPKVADDVQFDLAKRAF